MEKIDKYGWSYISEGENENRTYEIITPEKLKAPKNLNKLYSLNDNSISALLNQYIYATHPHQFNDIFDCFEGLVNIDSEKYIRYFVNNTFKELFTEEKLNDIIKNDFKSISTLIQRHYREVVYREIGVFSMTSNPYSLLMWSYYTNHQGFIIEFDISKFPFKFHGPFPLNYQENIEPISISESGAALAMLYQTNMKYKGWEHENEWRLLIESEELMFSPSFEELKKLGGHDRKFKYPIDAIKKIGFGNRFFESSELRTESDKVLNVTLKTNIENKALILDFLIANKINTCFALRKGLIEISYTGMLIEKKADNHYVFDISKYKPNEEA